MYTHITLFPARLFLFPLLLLMSNPRQTQPQHEHDPQKGEDNRLQNLHTLSLRQRADSKRQDRRPAATKRRRKANGADMQVPRQQLRRRDNDGREKRTQEESLKRDRHRGDVKVRHEPEYQLERHGDGDVDRHGELDAQLGRDEAEDRAAESDAEPEADRGHARVKVVGFADLDHELHDPAAERDLRADVGEEEEGAEPGDAGVGTLEEGGAEAAASGVVAAGVAYQRAVDCAGLRPEGCCAPHELNGG